MKGYPIVRQEIADMSSISQTLLRNQLVSYSIDKFSFFLDAVTWVYPEMSIVGW